MHARLKAPFIGSGSRNERTVRDTENKTACSKQVLPACMIELGISKDRPFVASLLVSHCESGNGIRTRSVRQGLRVSDLLGDASSFGINRGERDSMYQMARGEILGPIWDRLQRRLSS